MICWDRTLLGGCCIHHKHPSFGLVSNPETQMLTKIPQAAIQTLPLNAPKGKVDWAVFVSSCGPGRALRPMGRWPWRVLKWVETRQIEELFPDVSCISTRNYIFIYIYLLGGGGKQLITLHYCSILLGRVCCKHAFTFWNSHALSTSIIIMFAWVCLKTGHPKVPLSTISVLTKLTVWGCARHFQTHPNYNICWLWYVMILFIYISHYIQSYPHENVSACLVGVLPLFISPWLVDRLKAFRSEVIWRRLAPEISC